MLHSHSANDCTDLRSAQEQEHLAKRRKREGLPCKGFRLFSAYFSYISHWQLSAEEATLSTIECFSKSMEAPLTCPTTLQELEAILSHAGYGLIPVTESFYQEIASHGLLDIKFLFEGYGPLAEHMSSTLRTLCGATMGGWLEVVGSSGWVF